MKLYEVKQELIILEREMDEWASEHDGDVTEFPLLGKVEQFEGDLESKALSLGVWFKNLSSDAKAINEEKKNLAVREKAVKNKAERLKLFLSGINPNGATYISSKCVIGWRKSEVVKFSVEPESMPVEFQKVKIEADKA